MWLRVIIAVFVAVTLLRLGLGILRMMAQPVAEPPPPGELRKVKIHYRCSVCGMELHMRIAPHEEPDPPRHCQDEMDLVAPIE